MRNVLDHLPIAKQRKLERVAELRKARDESAHVLSLGKRSEPD